MTSFPFTLGTNGSTFPISENPYWSRVSLFQIQAATSKNYVLLGFKPGLPLQASELNEIQEIAYMNNTLTMTMNFSWPIYASEYQDGSPIYGPGWNGATPLYPKFDGENTNSNMVGYNTSTIFVREGWYLMSVKSSGLKHWIYLDQGYTAAIPTITENVTQYLGFTAYYETVKPSQDPALYDNSTGINIAVGAAAGADRIKVTVLAPFWTTNKSSTNFSPMAMKINNEADIIFMNNVPVPKE